MQELVARQEFALPLVQHEDLDINSIIIGERYRKELGDIIALADSIKEQGLLQPVGVDKDNVLVFGERRIRAFQQLGWSRIPVRRVNVTSIVEGEYAENDVREDFRPSERVAIAAAVADEIGERRGGDTSSGEQSNRQNIAEWKGKPTKEIAAEKSGFGNPETLRQAKSVVATQDPSLIEAMDSGKLSISAAAKAVSLPAPARQEVIQAADPKRALREATMIAAAGRPPPASTNRNPLYKPNESYSRLAMITGFCDSISDKIEAGGSTFLAEGILDNDMRGREIATIRRCIENLNELMGAINVK